MIAFPLCKVNLGLHILARRPDGYHTIETGFYPVPWCDVLEIVLAEKTVLQSTGIPFSGYRDTNLCLRAYHLLREDFDLPPVAIYLHKVIPVGSGLGGGSSDAACTLKLLNRLFDLHLPHNDLHTYASRLGSDCPFFLYQHAMLGSETGHVLTPLSLSLAGKHIALVCPNLPIASSEAYGNALPRTHRISLQEILADDTTMWKSTLVNDFERTVFEQHPSLLSIKTTLYRLGAFYAGLSGSGSAVFGLFNEPVYPQEAFPSMLCFSSSL